jgi:hypothetical protein
MKSPQPDTLVAKAPETMPGKLKRLGGSMSDEWNNVVVNQTVNSPWLANASPEERDKQLTAAVAALMSIDPKDELEGMLAAQLVASHNAAMECYRRAMHSEQTFVGRKENLSQANKLSRTHAALLEALNRHRGKGQQKVTVEHVTVNQGGQAIVRNVEHPDRAMRPADRARADEIAQRYDAAGTGGGSSPKSEGQPHALGHAPGTEMPGDIEAERHAVPIASGEG